MHLLTPQSARTSNPTRQAGIKKTPTNGSSQRQDEDKNKEEQGKEKAKRKGAWETLVFHAFPFRSISCHAYGAKRLNSTIELWRAHAKVILLTSLTLSKSFPYPPRQFNNAGEVHTYLR